MGKLCIGKTRIMNKRPKSDYEEAQDLREARRKYAAASIVSRYEKLRKTTGMSGAERIQSSTINQLVNQ